MITIKQDRREFIKYSTLGMLALLATSGVIISPNILSAESRLRPPGAVEEKEFLGLCIKCGQCLQVCPYHSIELADITKIYGVGTPFIDANVRGCYACEAVPCVLACPTGALDHHTEKSTDIKMGIAVLKHPRSCLSVQNKPVPAKYTKKMINFTKNVVNINPLEIKLLEKFDSLDNGNCSLCADMCPMPKPLDSIAIVQKSNGITRPEVYEGCIGCGVCQEVCPLDEPAIQIIPDLSYEDYYIKGKRV